MNRRAFLAESAVLALAVATSAACARAVAAPPAVHEAIALTEVFGDGMKLTAVALRYDRDIGTTRLVPSTYAVEGRSVTRVYANTAPAVAPAGNDGPYVIIELSSNDPDAALWGSPQGGAVNTGNSAGGPPAAGQSGPAPTIRQARAVVTQVSAVTAVDGSVLPPFAEPVITDRVISPVVDDFRQLQFTDPATGTTLDYNLFIPRDYNPARRYPLVLFMHDASVVGAPTIGPLVQGLGAVSWAGPDDQSRHPCFVLAPQYPSVVVDDTYQPTPLFDATVNLVRAVADEYSVDSTRMYATGQSMGAMMTIGMNIRHPELFAASYVVAGQWPTEQTGPLARKRLWVTVSEGDSKAYPGENAITALAESNGATVGRAVWDGHSTAEEFAAEAASLTAKDASINYVAFAHGSTLPDGSSDSGGASEHMGTWRIAYGIPGIRDWIMQQQA